MAVEFAEMAVAGWATRKWLSADVAAQRDRVRAHLTRAFIKPVPKVIVIFNGLKKTDEIFNSSVILIRYACLLAI